SIIKAYERFVIDKVISIVRVTLSPIVILPLLYLGYGAITMVIVTTIVNIICLLYSAYYCFNKLDVKIQFNKIDKLLLRSILVYSFFVFLGVVVDQIN